jgi:hypothetical protein
LIVVALVAWDSTASAEPVLPDCGFSFQEETESPPNEKTDEAKQDRSSDEPDDGNSTAKEIQDSPREMRLQLWDGTVVFGDVGIDNLHIKTRFGRLEVPVSNIVQLTPGLDSLPDLRSKIDGLIEKLGDRDFKVREQSVEQLLALGPMIVGYVASVGDGGSAERKKHLLNVLEQLNEEKDRIEDDFEVSSRAKILANEDSISTGEFTIVGTIEEQTFDVTTKFGKLAIRLADVRGADRLWLQESVTIRRTVEIASRDFFQSKPKETGVRVKRGDEIRIRASGSINWTSWGNVVSTPDGITNQGQWQGMNCGMLAAKIGKSGEPIPVGKEFSFVAKQDGELILAIAMSDNLASQQGYQWDGTYEAKLIVEHNPEK